MTIFFLFTELISYAMVTPLTFIYFFVPKAPFLFSFLSLLISALTCLGIVRPSLYIQNTSQSSFPSLKVCLTLCKILFSQHRFVALLVICLCFQSLLPLLIAHLHKKGQFPMSKWDFAFGCTPTEQRLLSLIMSLFGLAR